LDLQKHRWIVKGRFRDALQFQDSVAQFWQKTEFGPTLTIFLESDPEVASAIPPSFLSHRSTSLSKSRSRSSHSPSISSIARAAHGHHPVIAGQSSSAVTFEGPSLLTAEQKEALLTFLGIDVELRFTGPTLRNTYKKYKACINASKAMQGLRANQEWADHLEEHGIEHWIPVFIDLVHIFIAKSQFYSSWKATFVRAVTYPQMKSWLNNNSDGESDSEVWHEAKNPDHYTLADLTEWLTKKDVAKEKKPAVASSSGGRKLVVAVKDKKKKKKERKVTSSEESEDISEDKKLKGKAKAKSKRKSAK